MDKLTSAEATAKAPAFRSPGPENTSEVLSIGTDVGAPGLGVYVHFPWCIKKCPYCDFLSVPSARADIPHERYADAVLSEIAARREELGPQTVRSIFFGGGTPSLWRVAELRRVLQQIVDAFCPGHPPDEITVECNPGSLGYDTARRLQDAGVNRLSIGVQGLDDARLQFLGRWHDAERALASVRAAIESGMPRVSADLIYGVADQSPESAAAEVTRLAELGLSHVSAYALTIEPQTAFGALARKGRLPLAPEQSVADAFLAVDEALARQGLEHYEISNFARPGQRAEHNLGYWQGLDYIGLGCGAYGTVTRGGQRIRYRNRPQPDGYMDTALGLSEAGAGSLRGLESEQEPLSPETQLKESLMLGLRLAEGVDVEQAAARSGATLWTPARRRAATKLIERGRLLQEGPRLSIPKPSWLFSDGIISELL